MFKAYRNLFLGGSGYFGMASAYARMILLCAHKLVNDGLTVSFAINFMMILVVGVLAGHTVLYGLPFHLFILCHKVSDTAGLVEIGCMISRYYFVG